MNQKASKNQIQFPLLYNFAKDTPHVDDTFRNVEDINAPLLNDMIQPVWTKQVHNKSVFSAAGDEYYIEEGGLVKNGNFITDNNVITSKSLVKTKMPNFKNCITFDRYVWGGGDRIGRVYYTNASKTYFTIECYGHTADFSLGRASIVDARMRYLEGVFWTVLYLDESGSESIRVYKDRTLVLQKSASWKYQYRNSSQACSFATYASEAGGAAPCINIAYKNSRLWISFTKKAGTVNDLYNGSAFITLTCNFETGSDWKQIGDDLTFSNTTTTEAKTLDIDVTFNSGSSLASSSIKVITSDYSNYYFYNSNATSLDQCQKCIYIPDGYGNDHNYDIGIQTLGSTDYNILQFTLYVKTYSYWLTTRNDTDIKVTSIKFRVTNPNGDGATITGNNYQVPTFGVNTSLNEMYASGGFELKSTDYSKGKAVISFSYRYLSGQAEPFFENVEMLGSSVISSLTYYKTRYYGTEQAQSSISSEYCNTGRKRSNSYTQSSSDKALVPYAPCIVLDDGNFYTLFRPNINVDAGNTDNWWTTGCVIDQDRIYFKVGSLNISGSTYSIGDTTSGTYVPLDVCPIIRSGSVVIDQNLYIMTLKLNNSAAANPTSLNNNRAETASSRFTEVVFDSTVGNVRYLPGTSRLSSFNYYSNAVNGDPTLAGPGEDLAVYTVGGSRADIMYSTVETDTNHIWQALYNVTTAGTAFIQGISYNRYSMSYEGTLVTPWQSIDENSYIVNSGPAVYYRDKAGDVWEISVAQNTVPTLKTILEDRLIVWNGVDYTNCYDTESGKFFHYASDYNGRMRHGSDTYKTLPGAIAPDSGSWKAFPYIRYTANGKNPLYQVMPRDRIMSILLPIVARYRCYVDEYKVSKCWAPGGPAPFQPIDVFYSKLSSTACLYKYSIEFHSSTPDTPINHRLQGLAYPGTITTTASLTPNIFTEYVDGAGNNDLVIDGYDSYVMTYYDNEPYLVYSAATQASNVYSERDSFFVLQGQFYGIIKDKLYALTYSNGAISQMDAIIDLGAIQYIGNNPMIAFFWDPSSRTIRSFTGDANLDTLYSASKFTDMSTDNRHWYDETTQSIFVDTNKGLLVFGSKNTYLLDKFQNVTNMQFSNDGITHIMIEDGSTYNMKYYKDTGYEVVPIDIETSFYGLGANEYTNIDRWDITLFNPENIENATLKAGVRSLTDVSVVSEEKEFKITKDMYDKFTEAVLIRYVPKYQKGQGIRLYLETPLVIQKIVPHVADMGTGTVTKRGM